MDITTIRSRNIKIVLVDLYENDMNFDHVTFGINENDVKVHFCINILTGLERDADIIAISKHMNEIKHNLLKLMHLIESFRNTYPKLKITYHFDKCVKFSVLNMLYDSSIATYHNRRLEFNYICRIGHKYIQFMYYNNKRIIVITGNKYSELLISPTTSIKNTTLEKLYEDYPDQKGYDLQQEILKRDGIL